MKESKEKSIDFEKELKSLEDIVNKIESNLLPLDESIKLYEDGSKIIKKLESALKDAEEKMKDAIKVDQEESK